MPLEPQRHAGGGVELGPIEKDRLPALSATASWLVVKTQQKTHHEKGPQSPFSHQIREHAAHVPERLEAEESIRKPIHSRRARARLGGGGRRGGKRGASRCAAEEGPRGVGGGGIDSLCHGRFCNRAASISHLANYVVEVFGHCVEGKGAGALGKSRKDEDQVLGRGEEGGAVGVHVGRVVVQLS